MIIGSQPYIREMLIKIIISQDFLLMMVRYLIFEISIKDVEMFSSQRW